MSESLSSYAYEIGKMKVGESITIPRLKLVNLALDIGRVMDSREDGVHHFFADGRKYVYSKDDVLKRSS